MEEEGEVASLNPDRKSHPQSIIFVVESDSEGAWCSRNDGGVRVEFE